MLQLKLHTKMTLLGSAITIVVLAAMMFVITERVADLVGSEQRSLAELQARSLAEHVGTSAEPFGVEQLQRSTQLLQGGRPFIVTVRLWELSGNQFVMRVATSDQLSAQTMDESVRVALLHKNPASETKPANDSTDAAYFHAFAPYFKRGQLAGAVEVVERLDDIPALVRLYSQSAILIALMAVMLLTVATYLLFRQLIYRPIKRLLYAMARAKAGSLHAQSPVLARDEFGRLSEGFNRMMSRIGEMTREREAQQEILRHRVQEATAELRERNHELAEANLQLWDVSRRLGEMERLAAAGQTAAQFAHEVGTPLNLISCHVELLRDELRANPQSAESRTEIIIEQIERIERIVRQMMDRARVEKVRMKPVDVNLLIQRIGDAIRPKLHSSDVRLKLSLSEELPPIAGAPDYLQQIFINLINNSLDAMPDGGELAISTFVEENGNQVTVEIADTGCGMTEDVRAHIFDSLYTTKERGRGTGLGLVIVNQLMREHGGQIEVESEPGRGAKFKLYFPVAAETRELVKAEAAR
jgi:signal transduction histidine kinase